MAGLGNEGHFPEHFAEDRVATAVAPKLSLTTSVSQLSAVLPTNVPSEASRVLGTMCLPVLPGAPPFLQQEERVVVKETGRLEVGFGAGAQQRVMKAAAFRVGMSRFLPASPLGPLHSDTCVECIPGHTGTCITHEWVEVLVA